VKLITILYIPLLVKNTLISDFTHSDVGISKKVLEFPADYMYVVTGDEVFWQSTGLNYFIIDLFV
jgi:Neuraminidase (sialidase)